MEAGPVEAGPVEAEAQRGRESNRLAALRPPHDWLLQFAHIHRSSLQRFLILDRNNVALLGPPAFPPVAAVRHGAIPPRPIALSRPMTSTGVRTNVPGALQTPQMYMIGADVAMQFPPLRAALLHKGCVHNQRAASSQAGGVSRHLESAGLFQFEVEWEKCSIDKRSSRHHEATSVGRPSDEPGLGKVMPASLRFGLHQLHHHQFRHHQRMSCPTPPPAMRSGFIIHGRPKQEGKGDAARFEEGEEGKGDAARFESIRNELRPLFRNRQDAQGGAHVRHHDRRPAGLERLAECAGRDPCRHGIDGRCIGDRSGICSRPASRQSFFMISGCGEAA